MRSLGYLIASWSNSVWEQIGWGWVSGMNDSSLFKSSFCLSLPEYRFCKAEIANVIPSMSVDYLVVGSIWFLLRPEQCPLCHLVVTCSGICGWSTGMIWCHCCSSSTCRACFSSKLQRTFPQLETLFQRLGVWTCICLPWWHTPPKLEEQEPEVVLWH